MLERARRPDAPALHSSTHALVEPPLPLRCCAETGMHASSGGPSTRRDTLKRLPRAARAGIRLWPAADVDAQPGHHLYSYIRLLSAIRGYGSRAFQALDSGSSATSRQVVQTGSPCWRSTDERVPEHDPGTLPALLPRPVPARNPPAHRAAHHPEQSSRPCDSTSTYLTVSGGAYLRTGPLFASAATLRDASQKDCPALGSCLARRPPLTLKQLGGRAVYTGSKPLERAAHFWPSTSGTNAANFSSSSEVQVK